MLKKRAAQEAENRRREQDKLERDRDAQQARIRAEEADLKAERDLRMAGDQERAAAEYEARMQREQEEKIRKKQVLEEKIRRVEEQKQADQMKDDQESAEEAERFRLKKEAEGLKADQERAERAERLRLKKEADGLKADQERAEQAERLRLKKEADGLKADQESAEAERIKLQQEADRLAADQARVAEAERIKLQQEADRLAAEQAGQSEAERIKAKKEKAKRELMEEEQQMLMEARKRRQDEANAKKALEEETLRLLEEETLRLAEVERLRLLEEETLRLAEVERLRLLEEETLRLAEVERLQKMKEEQDALGERDLANAERQEEINSKRSEMLKDPKSAEIFELEEACSQNNISWSGHYMDRGKKTQMHCDNFQISFDGSIFGHGEDIIGEFTIQGSADIFSGSKEPKIRFDKQYKLAHPLTYSGVFKEGKIIGSYNYGSNNLNGEFELKPNSQEWKGWCMSKDVKTNTRLDIMIDADFVFGCGSDNIGNYIAKGTCVVETDEVKFVKCYWGGSRVMWVGKSTRINPNKKKSVVTINGIYFYQGLESSGQAYELKGRYGQLNNETGAQSRTNKASGAQTPVPQTPSNEKNLRVAIPISQTPRGEIETPQVPDDMLAKKMGYESMATKEGDSPHKPQIPKPEKLKQSSTKKEITDEKPAEKMDDKKELHHFGEMLKDKEILWQGWYTQESEHGKKSNKTWENFQIHPDKTCDGYGEDLLGEFELHGILTVTATGATIKIKQFYDEANVVYDLVGQFKHGGTCSGTWVCKDSATGKVTQDSGEWEMKPACQEWSGYMIVSGKKLDLAIDLIVEEDFVYCLSQCSNGFYFVRGDNDNETMKISFLQKYPASSKEFLFTGDVRRINPKKKKSVVTIKGTYTDQSNNTTGEFEIKGKYGQVGKDTTDSPVKKRTNKPRKLSGLFESTRNIE
jgi:hypothetical protein